MLLRSREDAAQGTPEMRTGSRRDRQPVVKVRQGREKLAGKLEVPGRDDRSYLFFRGDDRSGIFSKLLWTIPSDRHRRDFRAAEGYVEFVQWPASQQHRRSQRIGDYLTQAIISREFMEQCSRNGTPPEASSARAAAEKS